MLFPSWAILAAVLLAGSTQEITVILAPQIPQVDVDSVKIVAVSEGETELSIPLFPTDGEAHFHLATDRAWRITFTGSEFWCPEIEVPLT